MHPIDRAVANLDRVVEKFDQKTKAAAVPKGAVRKIVHRDANNRIAYVDEIPLDQIPEGER